MSTSGIWTVHCDSEIGNAEHPRADDCLWWCSEQDTAADADMIARNAGWTVVSRREAYCPPCQRLRKKG